MKWFASHKALSILGAIFLVLIVLLAASVALKDQDTAVGRVARTIVSVAQKPFKAVGDFLGDHVPGMLSDEDLLAENKELEARVAELEEELLLARLDEQELASLTSLSAILNGDGQVAGYNVVAADVVAYEGSSVFNIFTINVGTEAGVVRNSVVVSGDGLVGRVLESGEGWARVISVLDENNNVGLSITREGQTFIGTCQGSGEGTLTGMLLDETAEAEKGDAVYTSGLGGIYPPGILIGKVSKAQLSEETNLMEVTITPATDIKGLKKVGVLV
ncbi:MAG: rod shape-determining protein MreC [Clostridiales Family XIII bacterium]|jgi:rod shape-determining protein MreC|nr:rod shape-determining protein MreC [Clostridiales Family XIII bacterium]